MIGRRLIGLYEVTSVGGLVGFSIIITFASLRDVGQYSSRSTALRMYNSIFKPGIGTRVTKRLFTITRVSKRLFTVTRLSKRLFTGPEV